MRHILLTGIFIFIINSVFADVYYPDTIYCCDEMKTALIKQNETLKDINVTLKQSNSKIEKKKERDKIELVIDSCCDEKKETNPWKDFLPLFVALITGIFAVIQLRLNHIKNYRINWITELKENVSDYISALNLMNSKISNMVTALNKLDKKSKKYQEEKSKIYKDQYVKIEELNSVADKANSLIRLSISETKNKDLLKDLELFSEKTIDAYENRKFDEQATMQEIEKLEKKILKEMSEIINKEWKKIKSFWK